MKKEYILGHELCEKMKINLANVSGLSKSRPELSENYDLISYGKLLYINKNSIYLPNNMKKAINKFEFTDLEGTIPFPYFKLQYKLDKKYLKNFGTIIKICNKEILKFNDDVYKKIKNKVWYTLNEDEAKEYEDKIQVSKTKYLIYY